MCIIVFFFESMEFNGICLSLRQFLVITVANYGLAGQYFVHTDAIFINDNNVANKQMRQLRDKHFGDRFATVSD